MPYWNLPINRYFTFQSSAVPNSLEFEVFLLWICFFQHAWQMSFVQSLHCWIEFYHSHSLSHYANIGSDHHTYKTLCWNNYDSVWFCNFNLMLFWSGLRPSRERRRTKVIHLFTRLPNVQYPVSCQDLHIWVRWNGYFSFQFPSEIYCFFMFCQVYLGPSHATWLYCNQSIIQL